VLPRIVFFVIRHYGALRALSGIVHCFLVYSHSFPPKRVVLLLILFVIETCLSVELGGFDVIERRCEIDINISLYDANGIILIFGLDLQNVDLKLFAKNFDGDGIFLMQTCEVPQLVLQNSLGIVEIDELSLMRLQLDHMTNVPETFLEVRDQSHSSRTSGLGEFQHFEHPCGNVAQSFFSDELEHSTVSHLGTVLQAENQGIFVFRTQQGV